MNHEIVLNAHYKALALANLYVYYEVLDKLTQNFSNGMTADNNLYNIRAHLEDSIKDLEAKLGEHYGGID